MSGMPYPLEGISEGDRALLARMTREQLLATADRVSFHQKNIQKDILGIGSEEDLASLKDSLFRSDRAFDQVLANTPHLSKPLQQIRAWVTEASGKGDLAAISALRRLVHDPAVQAGEPRQRVPDVAAATRLSNGIEGVGTAAGMQPQEKYVGEQHYRNSPLDPATGNFGRLQYRAAGLRIETDLEDAETVSSMLDLVVRRGWMTIQTHGSAAFRQAVWLEGMARGVNVQGYSPTVQELEQGTHRAAAAGKIAQVDDDPVVRAFLESKTLQQRREAAERYPQLKNAFTLQANVEKYAEVCLAEPKRPTFIERIRQNIASDLANGLTLPAMQVREQQVRRTRALASER
ncbi:hypothetical protein LMG31884_47700 (plasmid) [Xanthomonas hydrangeae]|uniref:LPD7 domain-containing protein n=1 Tax=Xanthomonas hydrangeae TaxID=2775159 RepID=UPI001965D46E|nr:hypothetical protein LMG31884_47700 [Xanthomonas hydrangeae]CAD7741439.1 hypothetical protein LMG31884_47700 [Xanthomonas hydrangeae]CAD7747884.1 hypothetical protein LMG31887_46130 [Xanthomonas hydrangeae]CAD7747885.1 hypothetical protein LMG31887_46130 [Xanthomonas hydrangeae]CAD7748238.1 hypothetical protein LMG31885_45360 [Xanthomonas hydrangeae]